MSEGRCGFIHLHCASGNNKCINCITSFYLTLLLLLLLLLGEGGSKVKERRRRGREEGVG